MHWQEHGADEYAQAVGSFPQRVGYEAAQPRQASEVCMQRHCGTDWPFGGPGRAKVQRAVLKFAHLPRLQCNSNLSKACIRLSRFITEHNQRFEYNNEVEYLCFAPAFSFLFFLPSGSTKLICVT